VVNAEGDTRTPGVGPTGKFLGRGRSALLVCLVLVATFVAYARTLSYQFVYDDRPWLVENPALQSWRYLADYFTKQVWAGVYPADPGNYYRPVFMLWSRVNVALFGSDPGGYHFGAVLLHLLVTLLVFYLALEISADRPLALTAALVFGLHPVHIESVAWILGSTDSLAGVFMISSFLLWRKGRGSTPRARACRVASCGLYGLALLSKETALLLPLFVVAYDWAAREGGSGWRAESKRLAKSLRSSAPFIVLIIPYLAVRLIVLKGFSHPLKSISWPAVFMSWPELAWFWVKHLVWPVGLSSYYDLLPVTQPTYTNFTLPLIGALCAGLLLACGASKSRVVWVAAAWMAFSLIPALDLRVFAACNFAQDRFLYLPSIGFAIIVADLIRRLPDGRATLSGHSVLKVLLTCLLSGALGLGIISQSSYFRDDAHFFTYNDHAAPNNVCAVSNYGAFLGEQGDYAESAKLLEPVVARNPGNWGANFNLGRSYFKLNRTDDAVRCFARASTLDPFKPEAYLGLGLAWVKMRRYDEAENAFRRAIELRPDGYGYHFALGIVLRERGEFPQALKEFQAELAAHPREAAAQSEARQIQILLRKGTP
jgi:protein O-mannosyl-transferase